jgi:hypothetical protein
MHVISSGGIPLAFAVGLRGYRRRSALLVFGGFAVGTWQFSLGPTLGLPLLYLFCLLAVVAAVVWWRRGRPPPPRPLVVGTVAGVLLFTAVAVLIARPYLRVPEDQPDAERPPSTVEAFSDTRQVFAVAPAENLIWGEVTAGLRDGLQNPGEKTLFPGLLILGLAIAGMVTGPLPKRLRAGLALGVLGVCILALGFRESGGWLWPDRIAYDLLPGWDGIRTPGRLFTFATLGLALLAGIGACAAIRALRDRRPGSGPRVAIAATAVAVLAIAIEGRALPFDPTDSVAQPRVPPAPADVSDVPAPQLHLPALTAADNRRYVFWSTDGFPDIVNGRSSVQPAFTQKLIEGMDGFPDRASVALLRENGVRSVVLHLARVDGTPQEDAARRPVAGLRISRRRDGPLLIYDVRSPSASSPIAGRVDRRRRGG